MPTVTVQMWTGRTLEQKRRLVKALTDAMVEHAGAQPDALHVLLHEYSLDNWGRGGRLALDMQAPERPPTTPGPADPTDTSRRTDDDGSVLLHHLLLECSDLERSLDFYVTALGVVVRARDTHRDGRPLVLTHSGIGLTSRLAGGGRNIEHVAFAVESVDAIVERVPSVIARGPGPGPYGRTVYLIDPDGNEVECFERT